MAHMEMSMMGLHIPAYSQSKSFTVPSGRKRKLSTLASIWQRHSGSPIRSSASMSSVHPPSNLVIILKEHAPVALAELLIKVNPLPDIKPVPHPDI